MQKHRLVEDPDYPDYTSGVSIDAVTIDTLPVDISARTIESLKIDAIGEIIEKVDIHVKTVESGVTFYVDAAAGATFDVNIKDATGVTFNVDIVDATGVTFNVNITDAVTINVDAAAGATFDVNIKDATGVTFNVDIVDATGVTFNVNITDAVTINVDAAAGAVFDIKAAAGAQFDVTFDVANLTGKIPITFNVADLTGNIPISFNVEDLTGNIPISFDVANLTGDIRISIESPLTADGNVKVDITAQTVDVNIKTSGGANIVIDKLTQTAVGPRPVWETNYVASRTGFVTLAFPRGTVFARGMRGIIDRLRVWFVNTSGSAQTVTFKISPAVGMGPVISGSKSIPNGTDGYVDLIRRYAEATKSQFWTYDAMVVQLEASANLSVGTNSDCFVSYIYYDNAYYPEYNLIIAVTINASTVGDVPVSGTLNTIEIPSKSSASASGLQSVGVGSSVTLISVEGAGYCDFIQLHGTHPAHLFDIYCDGVVQNLQPDLTGHSIKMSNLNLYHINTDVGTCLVITKYDTANNYYSVQICLRLDFKRKFEIKATGVTAAGYDAAAVHVNKI